MKLCTGNSSRNLGPGTSDHPHGAARFAVELEKQRCLQMMQQLFSVVSVQRLPADFASLALCSQSQLQDGVVDLLVLCCVCMVHALVFACRGRSSSCAPTSW